MSCAPYYVYNRLFTIYCKISTTICINLFFWSHFFEPGFILSFIFFIKILPRKKR